MDTKGTLMTRREFLRALEEQLEMAPGSLNEHQALSETEGWDSMAAVLFIAVADERLGVAITGNQIARAKTLHDLLLLVDDRLTA